MNARLCLLWRVETGERGNSQLGQMQTSGYAMLLQASWAIGSLGCCLKQLVFKLVLNRLAGLVQLNVELTVRIDGV